MEGTVPIRSSILRLRSTLLLSTVLLAGGCHAQDASGKVPPDLARRIAVLIRSKASLPFNYEVKVGDRHPSNFNGFDDVTVFIGADGKPSRPMTFLISKDNKTLAQMSTFDLTKDPRDITSAAGRPSRGGDANAPVQVVVFDDLECPFCARMHQQVFPAVLNRYGNKVHIVYKDYPLEQHPWAIHAAVDANCLGDQSTTGYWNVVDYMHAHSGEIGGEAKTVAAADAQLDKITLDEGAKQKVDAAKLRACVEKQDTATVEAGLHEGEKLNLQGVPALFINGEMIDGAVPIEYVYRAIDNALLAQGITPPPAVPLPSSEPSPGGPAAR